MGTQEDEAFVQVGGARVGRSYWISLNATTPFAHLTATQSEITIAIANRAYVFPRGDIDKIWINTGFFSAGVQIEHHVPGHPKYVMFWTPDLDAVRNNLRRLGYETR